MLVRLVAIDGVDYQVDFSRRRQRDSTLFMKATMRVDNDLGFVFSPRSRPV